MGNRITHTHGVPRGSVGCGCGPHTVSYQYPPFSVGGGLRRRQRCVRFAVQPVPCDPSTARHRHTGRRCDQCGAVCTHRAPLAQVGRSTRRSGIWSGRAGWFRRTCAASGRSFSPGRASSWIRILTFAAGVRRRVRTSLTATRPDVDRVTSHARCPCRDGSIQRGRGRGKGHGHSARSDASGMQSRLPSYGSE